MHFSKGFPPLPSTRKSSFFPPSFTFFWLLLCNTSGSYFGGAKTNGFLISDFPSEMEFHLANLCSYTKFFAILVSSRPAQPTSRLLRPITMASRLVICATTKLAKVPISVLEELCVPPPPSKAGNLLSTSWKCIRSVIGFSTWFIMIRVAEKRMEDLLWGLTKQPAFSVKADAFLCRWWKSDGSFQMYLAP